MNLKNLVIAALASTSIITVGVSYHYLTKVAEYEEQLEKARDREANFCGGQDLGTLRITSVICGGDEEICICGDESILNIGL